MTTLREQLATYLTDWRGDLGPGWQGFFDGVEPALAEVDPSLLSDPAYPVIPGRRGFPNEGAPAGAHVFRAFDGIDPAQVSVVVIGQDPYPRVSRATGRAFEDGALTDWSGSVAISLQRLMQSAVSLRLGRPELARTPADWKTIRTAIGDGSIAQEPPGAYFDRLQQAGVLFVNAGWTLTRFVPGGGLDQKAHIAMWRPMMSRLLTGLASREQGRIVYLLLGGFARNLFAASGVEAEARARGVWDRSVSAVAHPHPNTIGERGYLARPNPLARVNSALVAMGDQPIPW